MRYWSTNPPVFNLGTKLSTVTANDLFAMSSGSLAPLTKASFAENSKGDPNHFLELTLGSSPRISSVHSPQANTVHSRSDVFASTSKASTASSAGGVIPFNQLVHTLIPKDPRKKFVCPVCLKESCSMNDLRRHYMIHTGEKPYPCPHCPYRSRFSKNVRTHIFYKHTNRDKHT